MNKRASAIKNETGEEPSVETLAQEFGVKVTKLTALLILQDEVRSLDEQIGSKGNHVLAQQNQLGLSYLASIVITLQVSVSPLHQQKQK